MRFNCWKVTGLVIGIIALVYKVVFAVMNLDGIMDWWGKMGLMYIVLYGTSGATIASACMKRTGALVTSIVVIVLSVFFMVGDGIMYLGLAATLNSTSLTEIGIMPLVNVANLLAGVFILIGAIKSEA